MKEEDSRFIISRPESADSAGKCAGIASAKIWTRKVINPLFGFHNSFASRINGIIVRIA
jgi:hypothetical protein